MAINPVGIHNVVSVKQMLVPQPLYFYVLMVS